MKFEKRIYNELNALIELLRNEMASKDVLKEVNEKYILRYINDSDLLRIVKKHNDKLPTLNEALLKEPAILEQVIKIIALMEVCETWQEFEVLIAKRKTNNVSVDFDKILKALVKVK